MTPLLTGSLRGIWAFQARDRTSKRVRITLDSSFREQELTLDSSREQELTLDSSRGTRITWIPPAGLE